MYNFTLIIPTHNRHNYLKRSIEYFKDLKATVIYCDSSENRYKGYIGKNMVYLHLPGKKFAEKILIALEDVNTTYVAQCADDDFILIDSLYKGIDFLEDNKDYKTLVGKYIGFHDKFDGAFYKIYQDLPKDITFDVRRTVELFFSNYYQILWAMYDKNILVKSFSIIKKANYYSDNFIELTIGAVVCFFGGIKFLNDIWGVRETNAGNRWGKRHKCITKINTDKNIQDDFRKFKKSLDSTTFDGFSELILESYLRGHRKKNAGPIYKILLKKILPHKAISLIRSKRELYKSSRKNPDLIKINSINNPEELGKIRNILFKYREGTKRSKVN